MPVHPALKKLRALTARLPESGEVEAWEHPTFRAGKKMFAIWTEREGEPAIVVKSTHGDQAVLTVDPRFYVPPYVGKNGWVGMLVDRIAWESVEELVMESWRMVALKRMVKALDGE